MPFDTLTLRDVQGLHGGQNLYLRADGRCVVQAVQAGIVEERFELTLSAEQLTALAEVLSAHDLAAIEIAERYGVPDEARPTITLKKGETSIEKAKWGNDAHADFDAIYGALLAIVIEAKGGTATASGKYDWDWSPEGY